MQIHVIHRTDILPITLTDLGGDIAIAASATFTNKAYINGIFLFQNSSMTVTFNNCVFYDMRNDWPMTGGSFIANSYITGLIVNFNFCTFYLKDGTIFGSFASGTPKVIFNNCVLNVASIKQSAFRESWQITRNSTLLGDKTISTKDFTSGTKGYGIYYGPDAVQEGTTFC